MLAMSLTPDDRPSKIEPLGYAGPLEHTGKDSLDPACCLVCGAMVCVPFITGIMAIVFGISSMRYRRPLAETFVTVGGIVLGVGNVTLWSGVWAMLL